MSRSRGESPSDGTDGSLRTGCGIECRGRQVLGLFLESPLEESRGPCATPSRSIAPA